MPPDRPILHHHDPSPFAEKVRLLFGIKRLAWGSVQVPMMLPKPDLVALTGGYRGTPVLQIGADLFCDTRLIVAEIERRWPAPPVLIGGPLVEFGLQGWADDALFPPGAALAMHEGAAALPPALLAERAAYFTNLDFTRFAQDADHFRAQVAAHLHLVERQLADGRGFLLGDAPAWTDLNAYHPVWMLMHHVPGGAGLLAGKLRLAAWMARLAGFGAGQRHEIGAEAALATARQAGLAETPNGRPVRVFPVAHPETAVAGRLIAQGDEEIVIQREDTRAGRVAVHFPAIGYRVEAG